VSWLFLERNNLSIGDKLTIGLGDRLFEQHSGDGAVTYIPERQWDVVKTVELEIVGAYEDVDPTHQRDAAMYWGYHPCTVFVPMSLLPIEIPATHTIKPGEFSLFIGDARNIDAFLAKAEPLAEEMGITLRFSDRGWSKVKDGINTSQTASLLTAVFFIFAASAALLLSVYLYIGRNKKTYAIMRALGVPHKKARQWLVLPLGLLTFLAVPVGGIIGIFYASTTIITNLEVLAEAGFTDTSLSIAAIILCFVCEIMLIALLTALFLWKMGRTPPLALLQGDVIVVANVGRDVAVKPQNKPAPAISFTPLQQAKLPPAARRYSAFRQVTAYILKHISRVKWKTAISLTLAVALTGALGFLAVTRLSYQELFKAVDVKYTMSDFCSSSVMTAEESELTEDLYYYSNFAVSLNASGASTLLTFTNDIERSFPDAEFIVDYTDGFNDLTLLNEDDAHLIIGSGTAEMLGLKPGDSIDIMSFQRAEKYFMDFENGRYDFSFDELIERILQESVTYTVAGVIESDRGIINTGIFAPLGKTAEKINLAPFPVTYSEFLITDNEKIHELDYFLEELRFASTQYSSSASFRVDLTELNNIRRVRDLLIMLFPIALAGAVLIGLTAPGLIIIQSAKEAAILRVLGVTKKRARCMLMFEQIGLCVIGIALAAGGLVLYNSGLFTRSAETLAVCGVLYLLGCVCAAFGASVSVTRRRILELLQVKE
jgi:ABC-type lipoprotein release transport system permease subunit